MFQQMTWVLLSLYLFTLFSPTVSAVSAIFTDTRSSSIYVRQECHSAGYVDICCEPLDLNMNDGRGYGWFHADHISFWEIGSLDATTTIYGKNTPRPCSSDVMVQRHGSNNWQYATARAEGAGSASVVMTHRAMFLRRIVPSFIYAGDHEYELVGWGNDKVATFQARDGNIIFAKMLETSSLFTARKPSVQ